MKQFKIQKGLWDEPRCVGDLQKSALSVAIICERCSHISILEANELKAEPQIPVADIGHFTPCPECRYMNEIGDAKPMLSIKVVARVAHQNQKPNPRRVEPTIKNQSKPDAI